MSMKRFGPLFWASMGRSEGNTASDLKSFGLPLAFLSALTLPRCSAIPSYVALPLT